VGSLSANVAATYQIHSEQASADVQIISITRRKL